VTAKGSKSTSLCLQKWSPHSIYTVVTGLFLMKVGQFKTSQRFVMSPTRKYEPQWQSIFKEKLCFRKSCLCFPIMTWNLWWWNLTPGSLFYLTLSHTQTLSEINMELTSNVTIYLAGSPSQMNYNFSNVN
jgi:hypothetical protein